MRLLVCLAAIGLGAAPAMAGCFTAEGMPDRAIYEGGAVLEYLAREGDVLTYRIGGSTTRLKDGLWPLGDSGQGSAMEYQWDTPLPGLAGVIEAGGKARAEGKRLRAGAAPVPVVVEVEVLGRESVEWEDCRYDAVEFRKTIFAGGRKEVEAVLLYAPDAMIAFRTGAVQSDTDKTFSYALKELQ